MYLVSKKFIGKFVTIAVTGVLLGACVSTATQGEYSTGPKSASVVTGAIVGAVVGFLGCDLLGGNNCEKYALGGAVVGGGVALYLLNKRQKAAYEAARTAGVESVNVVEYVDNEGKDKVDLVLQDQWYESPASATLSDSGKKKLEQTFASLQTDWEEGEVREVMEVSVVYAKESDASRLLAEERAQNLSAEFGKNAPNVMFNAKESSENLPEDNGQQIIIR